MKFGMGLRHGPGKVIWGRSDRLGRFKTEIKAVDKNFIKRASASAASGPGFESRPLRIFFSFPGQRRVLSASLT